MAAPVITVTPEVDDAGGAGLRIVLGTIAIAAGDYAAGGLIVRTPLLAAVPGQGVGSVVSFQINGIAGFRYEYVRSTGKAIVRVSAGFTPAGSLAAHTHDLHLNNADVADGATTRVNAGANLLGANTGADLLVTGLAFGAVSGRGGIIGLAAGSPAFTGTAVAAAEAAELATAALPAALVADVISFVAYFRKFSD